MWRRSLVITLTLGVLSPSPALAQTASTISAAKRSDSDVSLLAVQGEVRSGPAAAPRIFLPGETLRAGDLVTLRVAVDQPAYVYVIASEANGTPFVMFPKSGELRLEAGAVRTVPSDGTMIELDEKSGDESLVVVASRQPLPRNSPEVLRKIIEGSSASPQQPITRTEESKDPPPPPEPVRQPPMPIPTTDRGLKLICSENLSAVCARRDRTGFAIARLRFSHDAARRKGPLPTNAR